MPRRGSFNPKRRIAENVSRAQLADLADRVRYTGNPTHKRNPRDFNLTPPAQPVLDKTLCDAAGIVSLREAMSLLREGVAKGLVSVQGRGGFPQNIWSVTTDGHPLEAQLENQVQGTYHGYPMPSTDDFRDEILQRWYLA